MSQATYEVLYADDETNTPLQIKVIGQDEYNSDIVNSKTYHGYAHISRQRYSTTDGIHMSKVVYMTPEQAVQECLDGEKKHREQRDGRGFDDTELWNLDYTIISFVLPRLKAFNERDETYKEKDLTEKLNFIITQFEFYLHEELLPSSIYYNNHLFPNDMRYLTTLDDDSVRKEHLDVFCDMRKQEAKEQQKALELFAEIFTQLWD